MIRLRRGKNHMNMVWSLFIQRLGFSIPLFFFLLSKFLARQRPGEVAPEGKRINRIPFKKSEIISDLFGIVFALQFPTVPAMLIIDYRFTLYMGVGGIIASGLGFLWCIMYFIALGFRDLPDIPEDMD